jgi:lysophospholipase L1-like esterase
MKRFALSLILVLLATISGAVFSLRPATARALENNRYVALGDSVAAGAGLPLAVGTPEEQACGRSEQAYPYQVAANRAMYVEHLACSGAKADEGLYGPQEVTGNSLEPQLDRAFAPGIPDLMTVTIGANDVHWSDFVGKCYQSSCGSNWDSAAAATLLLNLRWELYQTLEQIKARSGRQPPQVVFTGYFMPFSATAATCDDTRGLTLEEIAWLNKQVVKINRTIRNAVSWYGFASYAPVDFTGHELCTVDPWVQGIKDPAPIHPTAAGQTAIAASVLGAVPK